MTSSPTPQRREAFRVALAGRTRVRRMLGETGEFELRDLSVGGARLVGGLDLRLDEAVSIVLELGDEQLEVAAQVVRLDAHGCGVRFDSLPPAVENRISRFLTDEQRRRVRTRD